VRETRGLAAPLKFSSDVNLGAGNYAPAQSKSTISPWHSKILVYTVRGRILGAIVRSGNIPYQWYDEPGSTIFLETGKMIKVSISASTLAFLAATALVVAIFASPTVYAQNNEVPKAQTAKELKLLAIALMYNVEAKLERARGVLDKTTRFIESSPKATPSEMHQFLASLTKSTPGIRSALILNETAGSIADARNFPRSLVDLSKRKYVEAARKARGRMVIDSMILGKDSGKAFIPVAKAAFGLRSGPTPKLLGYAVAIVQPILSNSTIKPCENCFFTLARWRDAYVLDVAPVDQKLSAPQYYRSFLKAIDLGETSGLHSEIIGGKHNLTAWRLLGDELIVTVTLSGPSS